MRFLGDDSEIDIAPATGHKAEFTEWRWVPLAEVVDLIVPFKRDVYVKVVEAFARTPTRCADASVAAPTRNYTNNDIEWLDFPAYHGV